MRSYTKGSMLQELEKICEDNSNELNVQLEAFSQSGKEVSFYQDLNPVTGKPDGRSILVTLESETDIVSYFKKELNKKVEQYLLLKRPAKDRILDSTVDFIKKNGRFPSNDEMGKFAGSKYLAAIAKSQAQKTLIKEVFDISKSIFEHRRKTNPKSIVEYDGSDNLVLSAEDFVVFIRLKADECSVTADMSLSVSSVHTISFFRREDGAVCANAENALHNSIPIENSTECLIYIHKGILSLSDEEGLKFVSEVDYEALT